MYIVTPNESIYHIAQSELLTLCGLWLNTNPEHRERKDDRQLSETVPGQQFIALCSDCDRKVTGKPEPMRPSPELLRSPKLIVRVP